MKLKPPFADLSCLTKKLQVLYMIALAITLELIVEDLRMLWVINHPEQYILSSSDELWQRITGVVSPLLALIAMIVHLVWVYKSYRNAQALSPDISTTPAMAVVYYFIPFLSLIKPCEQMQEIWQVSGKPVGWRNEKSGSLVLAWWTFYIISHLAGGLVSIVYPREQTDDIASYNIYYALDIASELTTVISYGLAAFMVGKIWERMKNHAPESSATI